MSLGHVVESTIGTGVAMLLYQGARKLAASIALGIVRHRLDHASRQIHVDAARTKGR